MIIPVLDPEGDDHREFVEWTLKAARPQSPVPSESDRKEEHDSLVDDLVEATRGYSAAAFASLRAELAAEADGKDLSDEKMLEVFRDRIPPQLGATRTMQELHAKLNCTHRSLLPEVDDIEKSRKEWTKQLRALEIER